MKKKNRMYVIIGILVLNLLVLFTIGQSFLGKTSGYALYVEQAQALAQKGLYSRAVEQYQSAIGVKDTVELRKEELSAYEGGVANGEFNNAYTVSVAVKEAVNAHNKAPELYEQGAQILYGLEQYQDCADLLMQARDLEVTSDALIGLTEQIRGLSVKTYAMYEEVQPSFDGMIRVFQDGEYQYLKANGSPCLKGGFVQASSFNQGLAYVQADTGEKTQGFIIDQNGQRQAYLPDEVLSCSGAGMAKDEKGNDILLFACETENGYIYCNASGEKVLGDYAFAGRFRNNIAAVQGQDGSWQLINGQGLPAVEGSFESVVLNEFDECAPKGLIFAKSGGKVSLYNSAGEKIEGFSCDDARAFADDYAAFCKNGLWGYIDASGSVVIEPQYQDAHSFSNGMAGVYNGDAWYVIDGTGKTVMDASFEDVGSLTEDGVLFVKQDGSWSYLTFYYTEQ